MPCAIVLTCHSKTAVKGDKRQTLLFDTGPEEVVWELNVNRLKPDLSSIDVIHLSHWHRDHSGISPDYHIYLSHEV